MLLALASHAKGDESALKKQIADCFARTIDEFGSLELTTRAPERTSIASGAIVSAVQEDADTEPLAGPFINFILFVKDGQIAELQIYKDDGKIPKSAIVPSAFIFFS